MPNPTMPQPVGMTDDELDEFTDLHDKITDLVGVYSFRICHFDPRSTRYEVHHFTFYISWDRVRIDVREGGCLIHPNSFGSTPLASLRAFWKSITNLDPGQVLLVDGKPTKFKPEGAFVPVSA